MAFLSVYISIGGICIGCLCKPNYVNWLRTEANTERVIFIDPWYINPSRSTKSWNLDVKDVMVTVTVPMRLLGQLVIIFGSWVKAFTSKIELVKVGFRTHLKSVVKHISNITVVIHRSNDYELTTG